MVSELKTLRNKAGLSQVELANKLGTTQKNISSWETGRTVPRPPMMQKVADFFGVKKDDIFFAAFNYNK